MGSLPKQIVPHLSHFEQKDLDFINSVYNYAKEKHRGQRRLSGLPYIIHPLIVATELAKDKYDLFTVAAGLLHDICEDTSTPIAEIEERFGTEIARIVEGVTKVSRYKLKNKARIFSDEEMFIDQVDNYRKILFAASSDPTVIVVKLYDRLHNIETVKWIPERKRKFYARETIEIFAPIAERLDMGLLKGRLEDAAFPFAYPDEYREFKRMIRGVYSNTHDVIESVIPEVRKVLTESNVRTYNISGRAKHLYSLYKKLKRKDGLNQIFDIIALRVIVDSVESCYKALGIVHSLYTPLPGQIDDYIARPKDNGYQSIHTTVRDQLGNIFEIQIRTQRMHDEAEFGRSAHWSYKESQTTGKSALKIAGDWINDLKEVKPGDKTHFLEKLQDELFSEQIFAFSPKGDIIRLPLGSTGIDFAYRIHTTLGHSCVGVKINGRLMPLPTKLATGDTVAIITNKNSHPSKDWLKIVKTQDARQKIRNYLRQENAEALAEAGREMIEDLIKKHHLPKRNFDSEESNSLVKNSELPYDSTEKAFIALADNNVSKYQVLRIFYPDFNPTPKKKVRVAKKKIKTISVLKGIRHAHARCCNPKDDDPRVGYLTKDHIIKVHHAKCPRIANADQKRIMDI